MVKVVCLTNTNFREQTLIAHLSICVKHRRKGKRYKGEFSPMDDRPFGNHDNNGMPTKWFQDANASPALPEVIPRRPIQGQLE